MIKIIWKDLVLSSQDAYTFLDNAHHMPGYKWHGYGHTCQPAHMSHVQNPDVAPMGKDILTFWSYSKSEMFACSK